MNPSPMPSTQERESALFALALEKPLTERSAFLQVVCGIDNVLRQRLEALIAAHDQPDNLVPTQAEAARPTIKLDLADAPEDEAVGQTLGRYKLLERVGEGGCGVVYCRLGRSTVFTGWPPRPFLSAIRLFCRAIRTGTRS